jgi:hypothetical protein
MEREQDSTFGYVLDCARKALNWTCEALATLGEPQAIALTHPDSLSIQADGPACADRCTIERAAK